MEALIGLSIAAFIVWKLVAKPLWLMTKPSSARRGMPGIFGRDE